MIVLLLFLILLSILGIASFQAITEAAGLVLGVLLAVVLIIVRNRKKG